ncbi:hypothetical protein ACEN4M_03115 [Marinilactibacillus psychrotolerans]
MIELFDFNSIVRLFSYMSNNIIKAAILGNLPVKMRKDLLKFLKALASAIFLTTTTDAVGFFCF